MRIAHLADAHLGFRQYHRQNAMGINQREADVANAFRAAVDDIIAVRPDAVLLAGDLFHAVRPTNAAIVFAFRQLQRLREALPVAPVVLIAGNHDTPRSAETGSILALFEDLGVEVAATDARRLSYPRLGLGVLAVPHAALTAPARPALEPVGGLRHEVLMLHGEVEGVMPTRTDTEPGSMEYGGALLHRTELAAGGWSYVALGHYHVTTEVAPRAWYSGSLEYVSPNPWGELREEAAGGLAGKGWLLVDLDSGAVERRPVPLARRLVDLEPIEGADQTSAELDAELARRMAGITGGHADQVVRVLLRGVPRHVARLLDHEAIRRFKAEALHFQLDLRPARPERRTGVGAPGRRQTLPDLVADFLGHRPLPAEVDRERFVARGRTLLETIEQELLEQA